MKNKILISMGTLMLVCMMTIGFFSLPVGFSLCGIIGLIYGIKCNDKNFVKWSLIALLIGIALIVYALLSISAM